MISQIENIFRSDRFAQLAAEAVETNEWTTEADIQYAVMALTEEFLDPDKLSSFIDRHSVDTSPRSATVGIVCAGNLPLVGFGDMFYSLISGCRVVLKPSSKEPLMRAFDSLPGVTIVETIEELRCADHLIAMGSDQTCSMLAELMPHIPTLLRGSMHSIAILAGDETDAELEALADDIFRYCSRGCRSVTHIYLPAGYDVDRFRFAPREMRVAWNDCYRYQRARAVLGGEPFTDGGFYLLKPVPTHETSVVGYSYYTDRAEIPTLGVQYIAERGNFGRAQIPTLDQFANGVNVIDFLR